MTQGRFVFGYGSLVNCATHRHAPSYATRLEGWRRIWRGIEGRDCATLSIHPVDGADIDGIIAGVALADWAALDQREALYRRHDVSAQVTYSASEVLAYAVPPEDDVAVLPILLSYLDVVVQGYETWFGEAGVAQFFATTDGWTGITDDRAQPIYPRHQVLLPETRALTDKYLAKTILPSQTR